MITKKQITETYKGKRYDEDDRYSVVTTISFFDHYAVLMSGHYDPNEAGYYVEACIDRNTGENVIDGNRPCDDKSDAIDVALEMME